MTEQSPEGLAKPIPAGLALMRAPFPDHQINLLPKPTKNREEMDKLPRATCRTCGGYHATSNIIHLSYVGHAALTDRLLECDPNWSWEPLSIGPDGLPKLDENGGMWIKLTVCGVTRLGYGDADGKKGGNAVKERIGDAIRNAAMRFGAGLEFWHKGDLHVVPKDGGDFAGSNASDDADDQATSQTLSAKADKPAYSAEQLDANLPLWTKRIAAKKSTHADIIATVESKYTLTEDQKKKINAIKSPAAAPAAEESQQ